MKEFGIGLSAVAVGVAICCAVIIAVLVGWAKLNVWRSALVGEAELAQASYNRQIIVQEAQAKMEASKMLAQAEVERAKGVAQANTIIGNSLKDNEAYLRYLWIDSLDKTQGQVVYIPTEANLPILEAKRLDSMKKDN